MYDGVPQRVTKEERLEQLENLAKALKAEAEELVRNVGLLTEETKGEDVKSTKPKAVEEKIDNPDGIRDAFGKE